MAQLWLHPSRPPQSLPLLPAILRKKNTWGWPRCPPPQLLAIPRGSWGGCPPRRAVAAGNGGLQSGEGLGEQPWLPAAAHVAARSRAGCCLTKCDLFWAVAAASACQRSRRWRLSAASQQCKCFRWVSVFHTPPMD